MPCHGFDGQTRQGRDRSEQSGLRPGVGLPAQGHERRRRCWRFAQGYSRIITIEEHSLHGGLGSIVSRRWQAKLLAEIKRIGIAERFSGECGSYAHLLTYHGLDRAALLAALR
ncbi:MAG: transketolase C-terminal domain-containing protein [Alphaproteobacteria bacterium]